MLGPGVNKYDTQFLIVFVQGVEADNQDIIEINKLTGEVVKTIKMNGVLLPKAGMMYVADIYDFYGNGQTKTIMIGAADHWSRNLITDPLPFDLGLIAVNLDSGEYI